MDTKRRIKKVKRREIVEYTLTSSSIHGSVNSQDQPVQSCKHVIEPVYIFRASTKRHSNGRPKRNGSTERIENQRAPKLRRLIDSQTEAEQKMQLSRIQEEMKRLTVGFTLT